MRWSTWKASARRIADLIEEWERPGVAPAPADDPADHQAGARIATRR
jgi:hypothetical protein